MGTILLNTAYFPRISYFGEIKKYESVRIEAWETFGRRSPRNRCEILSANGILLLTVPVVKAGRKKIPTRDVRIDYSEPWQKKHFRALESAYANSPYYLYYIDEIMSFFQNREKFIIDLNMKILETLFSILGWNKSPALSEDYVFELDNIADYREGSSVLHREIIPGILPAYRQTFGEKFSFVPDLSILDMLFNLGPDTDGFLE